VTLTVSVLCLGVKILQYAVPPIAHHAVLELGGTLPFEIATILDRPVGQWADYRLLTPLTALFIHADWPHLLGNMVYLWVFGIPIERRVGWVGMLLIFLLGGAIANLFVALRLPDLTSPIIGASGAVSAVVGAYLITFPRRRIGIFLPLGLYLQFARVPSLLVIGSWFTLQLVYTALGPITGVVAWWTHMVGFTLGLIFVLLVRAAAQIELR
jgi:membrane associated rhomboid family serine protease